ncbi:AbgT family transporter [Oceanobacillus sp. FSL K6-2867]|uniref:AbgT family transporter n=1 Tax=Oceanobacillus sp. FSL K6-2867 TaxID=2954748 RepID=UPI0030DCA728
MKNSNKTQKDGIFSKFLTGIEVLGNKLPDPFMLFALLAGIVILASYILNLLGAAVLHPGTGEELPIENLASGEGIQFMLTSMLENFTGFAPLGLVLAMMLGVGLAEKVGLLDYAIRKTILNAPRALVTYAVIFVGIMGNIASDAAMILIPPLAAMVFYKIGRHPIAGLVAGFSAAGAGFTANLLIVGTDALLSGISTEAAAIIDNSIVVTPVDNWYFNIVSVFLLTVVGALVTEKIVEPRLGKYAGEEVEKETEDDSKAGKAFRNAIIAGLVYIAILVIAIFIPNSPLTNENGGIIPSPFLDGIIPIILFFFLTIGITYGITIGNIKSGKDITKFMAESIKELSGYIVLIFAIAQFIAYFNWSNIGIWIAVNGADFLTSINFTGIWLIIGYIVLTAVLEFFITSGSAKWALEAPIFVPMFMQLGYHPAFTQAAYRVADSSMSIMTPLNPYIIIVLSFMQKYDKKAGLGTLMAFMLPYAFIFLIVWILLIMVFYFFNLPLGPGVTPFL